MIKLIDILNETEISKCPAATQNIELNLQNRQKAINEYGYGPLNPNEPNEKFWQAKADMWQLDSIEEAKTSLCGNCAAFDITTKTLDCIAKGIGNDGGSEDPFDVIDANIDMNMNPETIQEWIQLVKKMVKHDDHDKDVDEFIDL